MKITYKYPELVQFIKDSVKFRLDKVGNCYANYMPIRIKYFKNYSWIIQKKLLRLFWIDYYSTICQSRHLMAFESFDSALYHFKWLLNDES